MSLFDVWEGEWGGKNTLSACISMLKGVKDIGSLFYTDDLQNKCTIFDT